MRSSVFKIFGLIIFLINFVALGGCKEIKLVDPDDFSTSDVIVISAESGTIKANGVDKVKVTAALQGDTQDGLDVVFTTDAGRFAGVPDEENADENKQRTTVKAAGRIAEVYLVSSTEEQTAVVSAAVEKIKDITEVKFDRVKPKHIYLSADKSIIIADGTDKATLTARLRPENDIGTVTQNTLVIFEATHPESGTEISNLYREDYSNSKGEVVVFLTSNKIGDYRITCSVPDAEGVPPASVTIKFVPKSN